MIDYIKFLVSIVLSGQISDKRLDTYQRLWPLQREGTAQTGYIHSCAAARDSDEASENHCISSILLSTEGHTGEMNEDSYLS